MLEEIEEQKPILSKPALDAFDVLAAGRIDFYKCPVIENIEQGIFSFTNNK